MKYSILIVNYKTKEKVLLLIDDLKKLLRDCNYEILIIENNSGDKFEFSEQNVNCFYTAMNLGFGKAMNYAVMHAKGEILILLNPDCRINPNQDLDSFISANLDSQTGILTSLIKYPDGRIQPNRGSSSGLVTYIFQFLRLGRFKQLIPGAVLKISLIKKSFIGKYLEYSNNSPEHEECYWVSGAFMIMRKKVFEDLKGFDPNFFMYCEDEDLCIRVRYIGLKIVYSSKFTLVHEVGGAQIDSIDQRLKFSELKRLQSNIYFLQKHQSKTEAIALRFFYGIAYLVMMLKLKDTRSYFNCGLNFLTGRRT